MRLSHFPRAQPVPFTISHAGSTVDDFGDEIWMTGNAQWHAASDFVDDNLFDCSVGYGDNTYPVMRGIQCT